ncbi:MAG: DMT family transporter [Rothia sp. (in: high G+C Gram-positive bacteria)]|nr:DMT family transporter [Rothia sp. (in: high G+C Gram-positive bacteria)]
MLAISIMVLGGALLPVQTTFNSRLREAVGSPFLSSFVSFTGGTIFLVLLATLVDGTFWFSPAAVAAEPAWIWLGGLLGVIGLTTNIFIFPQLGGVQAVILPITGQILMGLITDQFGFFNAPQKPLTPLRAAGVALVLAGVLAAVLLGKKKTAPSNMGGEMQPPSGILGWQLLAVFTGFLMAMQSAINGYLGTVIGSGVKAALVSFSVGTLVLLMIVLALRLTFRVTVPAGKVSNPFWMWAGGPLGATFVTLNALFVPLLGTGATIMAALTGMIAAFLVVDRFGIFEAQQRPVRLPQIAGLLVMLAGIALIRLT